MVASFAIKVALAAVPCFGTEAPRLKATGLPTTEFDIDASNDFDFNEIEKNWQELINSPYDPENYFKPEGTK